MPDYIEIDRTKTQLLHAIDFADGKDKADLTHAINITDGVVKAELTHAIKAGAEIHFITSNTTVSNVANGISVIVPPATVTYRQRIVYDSNGSAIPTYLNTVVAEGIIIKTGRGVLIGDRYLYEVSGETNTYDLYTFSKLQPKLVAGANVTLSRNQDGTVVISASGGGGGGTSDYADLSNKPQINSVTLSGNKSLSDLGIAPAFTVGNGLTLDNNILKANDISYKIVDTLPQSDIDENTRYLTKKARTTYNYGSYCSNKVLYPTDNLPAISISDGSIPNFVLYNSLDNYFYFVKLTKKYSGFRFDKAFIDSGVLKIRVFDANVTVYKYNSLNGDWVQDSSSSITDWGTAAICSVSDNSKFKFLFTTVDFNYVDDEDTFAVTNNIDYQYQDGYIYANFFETTGAYKDNDLDNADESNIYIYNINAYRNSAWSVVGEFDLQKALESFAKSSDLTSGLATKQDTLVNQSNIKSINGISLLGSGDIEIGGGDVDTAMSDSSTNAVQNKVIKSYVDTEIDDNIGSAMWQILGGGS